MRCPVFIVLTVPLLFGGVVHAESKEAAGRRAKPPQWSQEVRDVFFEDARKELVGTRPVAELAKPLGGMTGINGKSQNEASSWSELIQAETLQTEIKRVVNGLAGAISSSGKFQGGGYEQCRHDFSLLAVWFRVVGEFDEQVRWKKEAGDVRQHLGQAAALCEKASEPSYSAAKQMHGLLTELLRGQSAFEDSTQEKWQVDRSLLMLRMEQSVEEILGPSLSSKKIFRRRNSDLAHEAQLLAVLAKVIIEEGYESADDEEFSAYARQLGEASTTLVREAEEKNYEAARSAAGRLTQSCSACHEDFRG
ncbi:MAG: cytochrome c [Planctomycetes bacterium]|nr:cytochrome c [Planctomycetota bacterium]